VREGAERPAGAVGRHPARLAGAGSRSRRARWTPVLAVAAVVAALTALFGFALGQNPDVVQPVLVGKPAPDFSLRTLDGSRTVSLASLRGQVVVVNFWASWCADCRVEHPALTQAFDRYRDQGVTFVGVSFEDGSSAAESFARASGIRWPLVNDPGSATAIDFGVTGVPETFVIGPGGRIAAKTIGPVRYMPLSAAIAGALPGGSP
jgi:cytochrome c biogenesis protein CcmG/thiol:disulfide interchange protein DsbE